MDDSLIVSLCSNNIFRRIMTNQPISLCEFHLATDILVNNNIPYDISFDGGTRKLAPAIQLTIHINPSRTEVLVITLSPGSNAFTASP